MFTLTIIARPSNEPRQLIPVGNDPPDRGPDFSGNGILDLALTNRTDDTVSVLMGNGDGTFQPAVDYAVGADPDAIVAADFAGDGILDLAVANSEPNFVSILMGNGDGTFRPAVDAPVGGGPDAIVAGDFNGDGQVDLAVAKRLDNDVSILLGNGDGTFQSGGTFATGSGPDGITAGDFARDGKLDLAVANSKDNTVSILLGNGDGTFRPGGLPRRVDVVRHSQCRGGGGFHGNGILDLAVTGQQDGSLTILMGHGDGTFQPPSPIPTWWAAVGIAVGDFNGDGKLDLALADGVSTT